MFYFQVFAQYTLDALDIPRTSFRQNVLGVAVATFSIGRQ